MYFSQGYLHKYMEWNNIYMCGKIQKKYLNINTEAALIVMRILLSFIDHQFRTVY